MCTRLEELGEDIGQSIPKLKRLVLHYCWNLRRLPESISHLVDLEHLDLTSCEELMILPHGIVDLVSLRQLKLSFCTRLLQLAEELGNLTNLETLDLSYFLVLSELPASIGGLKMLTTLEMYKTKVRDLPAEFGLLSSLTTLHLPRSLRSVPETFQGLQALHVLRGCADLSNLGALTALNVLDLSNRAAMTIFPKSLGNLKLLVDLRMWSCPELLVVEALPEGLEHLELSDCPKLTKIPSLVAMRSLIFLDMRNCSSLGYVYGLECLTALEYMDISGCTAMEGRGIQVIQNRVLHKCHLDGSKVGVAYNNRWLEVILTLRVLPWYSG